MNFFHGRIVLTGETILAKTLLYQKKELQIYKIIRDRSMIIMIPSLWSNSQVGSSNSLFIEKQSLSLSQMFTTADNSRDFNFSKSKFVNNPLILACEWLE
jgi:hypothetical protein